MKKTAWLFVTALMVTFFVKAGYSQDAGKTTGTQKTTTSAQGKFVDNNKNGTCDNFESRGNTGKGRSFVDKDGNGICDNRGTAGQGYGRGNGQGKGAGCGQGCMHRHGHGKGQGNCGGRGPNAGKGKTQGNYTK